MLLITSCNLSYLKMCSPTLLVRLCTNSVRAAQSRLSYHLPPPLITSATYGPMNIKGIEVLREKPHSPRFPHSYRTTLDCTMYAVSQYAP